jgi:hypothetical protein
MGSIQSYVQTQARNVQSEFIEGQTKQSDAMRSTQVAMQIAMARDQVQWGCGLFSILVAGAASETVKNKALPPVYIPPLVLGGFILSYLGDMAYGNKLTRVRQEAEHILAEERTRLVPPSSMPARKLWTKEADEVFASGIPRVGKLWPMDWTFKKPPK